MTTAATHLTVLLSNAHSRGETVIDVETRKPGLYGVGGPGRGGLIAIVEHPERGLRARLDVSADGAWDIYPLDETRTEARESVDFWKSILD